MLQYLFLRIYGIDARHNRYSHEHQHKREFCSVHTIRFFQRKNIAFPGKTHSKITTK
jgi:hypothetical protein